MVVVLVEMLLLLAAELSPQTVESLPLLALALALLEVRRMLLAEHLFLALLEQLESYC